MAAVRPGRKLNTVSSGPTASRNERNRWSYQKTTVVTAE